MITEHIEYLQISEVKECCIPVSGTALVIGKISKCWACENGRILTCAQDVCFQEHRELKTLGVQDLVISRAKQPLRSFQHQKFGLKSQVHVNVFKMS